uniref:Uncharacterized protein n=1 Tax=Anopheles minimus TaxID=112268 RepID=A0A182WQ19_9DIPT
MEYGYKYSVAIIFILLVVSIMLPAANAMPKGVVLFGGRGNNRYGPKTTRSVAASLTTEVLPCSIITSAMFIVHQINFMSPITLTRSSLR